MKDLGHGVLQIEPGETVQLGTYRSVPVSPIFNIGEQSGPWCPRCGYKEGHAQDCRELMECTAAHTGPVSPTSTRTQPEGYQSTMNEGKGTQDGGGTGGVGVGRESL